MSTPRAALKRLAESSLARSGLPRLVRARHRREVLVLAYHNVVPRGERAVGDLSLHLPQDEFARQMESLRRTHEVVALDSLLEPRPHSARPRAVVTFDDAYHGALTAGVDELVRRGMPATVFVTPAYVGGGTFWWDEYADPARGLDPALREYALGALRGQGERVGAWMAERGEHPATLPAHLGVADEVLLGRAAACPGITLASHTWSHPNLAALAEDELDAELARPLAWLRERFQAVVPWLSYPYGLSSPLVERAAERAGYRGAFRVEGGWTPAGATGSFALPRMNVPAGVSLHGFELRTAGFLDR
ncbi:MAG TPA: polysaccharide deacetylase family protein [Longimicrobium sp.]